MSRFLLVTVGGAVGSGARYLLSSLAHAWLGVGFPFGTLAVNVLGSFCICAIMQLGTATNLISPPLRLFLTTGVMGGFTTYSAFNYETFGLVQRGSFALAAANVGLTLALCFAAGVAGDAAARALL